MVEHIKDAVQEAMVEFESETGMTPDDIYIELITVSTFGIEDRRVLSNVRVTISI